MTVRWGIVGPGRIASKVVADFPLVPGAEAVAVASRSIDRAKAFAAEHGIDRAHGSYREILDDPDVDVLYIATPHPQHRAVALAALRAGKAVLVEKAFTVTPQATARDRRRSRGSRRLRHGGDVDAVPARRRPRCGSCSPTARSARSARCRSTWACATRSRPATGSSRPSWAAARCSTCRLPDLVRADGARHPDRGVRARRGDPDGVDLEESVLLAFAGGATAT